MPEARRSKTSARSVTSWQEIAKVETRGDRPRGGYDAVNKTILCDLLGLTPADIWAVKQGNGGVTVVDINPDPSQPAVVTCLNLTSHFECDRSDRRGRPRPMHDTLLLDPVRIPMAPERASAGAALIESGVLSGFGDEARTAAAQLGVQATAAPQQLLALAWWTPHGSALTDQRAHRNHPQPASLRCRRGIWPGGTAAAREKLADQPERLIGLRNADPSSVHPPLGKLQPRRTGRGAGTPRRSAGTRCDRPGR